MSIRCRMAVIFFGKIAGRFFMIPRISALHPDEKDVIIVKAEKEDEGGKTDARSYSG